MKEETSGRVIWAHIGVARLQPLALALAGMDMGVPRVVMELLTTLVVVVEHKQHDVAGRDDVTRTDSQLE